MGAKTDFRWPCPVGSVKFTNNEDYCYMSYVAHSDTSFSPLTFYEFNVGSHVVRIAL